MEIITSFFLDCKEKYFFNLFLRKVWSKKGNGIRMERFSNHAGKIQHDLKKVGF
ncbi:hypothetical protein [uncultured Treponema sp.]|uniref:hypothetical protein n=1 Tax=uncultured Treponema sp. TaxID=162155 RepID=UPI0025E58D22|nr:hypothetical protein [uncultured Treponema sp.]